MRKVPPEPDKEPPDKPWSPLRGLLIFGGIGVIGLVAWIAHYSSSPGYQAYQRGSAYFVNAQYSNAIAEFDKAIKLDPQDSMSLRYRGDAFLQLGQYQKAVDDYTKCLDLMDRSGTAKTYHVEMSMIYQNRSVAYKKLGNLELAAKDKAAASKLGYNPSNK